MKFLIDVHASGSLAHWLSARGHDVVQVEEDDVGMSDDDICGGVVKKGRSSQERREKRDGTGFFGMVQVRKM